jgi:hypothetical protein
MVLVELVPEVVTELLEPDEELLEPDEEDDDDVGLLVPEALLTAMIGTHQKKNRAGIMPARQIVR